MEDIIDELKALGLEINQSKEQKLEKWLTTTAKLYEKLLVQEYLESRKVQLKNIEDNVKKNIETIVSATPISVTPDVKQEGTESLPGSDEVRVVPHPEGPPVSKATESIYVKPSSTPNDKWKEKEQEKVFVEKPKTPTIEKESVADKAAKIKKKSINEKLSGKSIKVGLNDRIAFVKHLFNNSAEDYNRVVSQLNTFKSLDEAQNFIEHLVKPEYHWNEKEEYEERFMELLENRFG